MVRELSVKIENPALSGLIGQYNKFCKDQEYINVLTYRIVHALFITAIYDTREDEDNEVTLENGHTVKKMVFPLVANDKNGSKAVPVFTDMVSFNRWINVFDKQKGMVVPNSFQVMSGVSLNGNNGIVINPFNLNHIFIFLAYKILDCFRLRNVSLLGLQKWKSSSRCFEYIGISFFNIT